MAEIEYGENKEIDGVVVNEKCKELVKKLKKLLIQNRHLLID